MPEKKLLTACKECLMYYRRMAETKPAYSVFDCLYEPYKNCSKILKN